jgi:hypothetical protein
VSQFLRLWICISVLSIGGISIAQNLLSAPESVVFDALHNRYLASNYNTGHIVAIDSTGNHSYFVQNNYCKNGLHIQGNTVYAACIDSGVKGFDLDTRERVMHVNIPGMINLNDITSDSSGNLYISDVYASRIYKIRISDQTYSTFVDCPVQPNGLYFDPPNNRLIVATYGNPSPIQAVSLEDSSVTTLVNTGYSWLDGITQDSEGNWYFSTWHTRSVYKYNNAFTNPCEFIYGNPGGPADIFFNREQGVLAIPVMWINAIVFLPVQSGAESPGSDNIPANIQLGSNYPNPFNPVTVIPFSLPITQKISLKIYNIRGQEVVNLANGFFLSGQHEIAWNATGMASGMYVAHLVSGDVRQSRTMVLAK